MYEIERLWILVARRLANEASAEELQELQGLLQKYPQEGYAVQILSDLCKSGNADKEDGPEIWVDGAGMRSRSDADEADAALSRHLERFAKHFGEQAAPTPASRTVWGRKEAGKKSGRILPSKSMLSNYLKVSWRHLARNRSFSIINIAGLAIGMASAMLLLLWINFQFSVNKFHAKGDRIYQVYNRMRVNGNMEAWGATPMVMAPILEKNYPLVQAVARTNWVGAFVFSAGDKHFETNGFITDPGFLQMFSFQMREGDPTTALNGPHSVVLTEPLARKLFGETSALGKTVKVDSNGLFTVTGVCKDLPANSSLHFEYLIPWSYMKEVHWEEPDWDVTSIRTFVMMKPGVTEAMANASLHNITKDHAPGLKNEIFVHPMRKWWLYSGFENGVNVGGWIEYVRLFAVIAAFILLIACINYMNLSTARTAGRAREVGIRKTVGAGKGSLIGQFLGESVLMSLLAFLLALFLIQPGLAAFNQLVGSQLTLPYQEPEFWEIAAAFVLFTGLLAGSYPSFYLSAFKPMYVLKGMLKAPHNLATPRKVLVVVQFTIAIVLMISTIVIYRQIDYAQKRDPGYNRTNLAYMYIKGDMERNYPAIRQELLRSGAITSLTRSNSPVTDIWIWDNSYVWPGKVAGSRYGFAKFFTYSDLVATVGLQLLEGRDIDMGKYPDDSSAIVLNQAAVKLMGLKDPVGQELRNKDKSWHIVGVIKDFIPESPYHSVPPIVCQGSVKGFGTLMFRLNPAVGAAKNIATISAIIKRYNPNYPFDYYMVDKTYARKFEDDQQFGKLAAIFAGLTIFISCLGLFGLATSMAENRVKEIGVRKVLGASVGAITTLLSKDFLKWVVISFVLASPVAWWAMHAWLQHYAYRVNISWWVFVVAGAGSILVSMATVSYKAIKAALASPVKSLRTE